MINAAVAGAILVLAGCAHNQPIQASVPDPVLSAAGQNFLFQAQQEAANERDLAVIARNKSANKNIKTYADMVIKDDIESLQKLSQLAQKYKLKQPAAPAEDSKDVTQLKRSSRRTLDKEFLKLTVQDEGQLAGMLKGEASSPADPDVRDYANNLMPVVETELKKAQELQSPVKNRHAKSSTF